MPIEYYSPRPSKQSHHVFAVVPFYHLKDVDIYPIHCIDLIQMFLKASIYTD